jgi:hypothetical protein
MKGFRFRLERVLSWRETQLTLAEAKEEQLKGALRATDTAVAELAERRTAAQGTVGRASMVSGAELDVFERLRVWTNREEKRLANRKLELQRSIEEQNRSVAESRRGVKLVERLKERKHQIWKGEADREIDELAGESAIAQWRRLHPLNSP